MRLEYIDFGTPLSTLDENELIFDESKRLLHACNKHPNIKVVELRCVDLESDIIVIDRADETVCSRNVGKIKRAKERLALLYNPNPKLKYPYEVRPLRDDFPQTQHQFHVLKGKPKSLCLYNDAWSTVERTWTPEKHLERIFWWLKKASEEKLHGKSDPLEQLYYVGSNKILLPPNFNEASSIGALKFHVSKLNNTWYEGKFYVEDDDSLNPNEIVSDALVLNVNPVITGVILDTPESLGELNQQLKDRGSGLLVKLKESILSKVPSAGVEIHPTRKTFIFINTPIVREQGMKPERTNTKCYVVDIDMASLGLKLGVLIKLPFDKKAYKDKVIEGVNPNNKSIKLNDSWKDVALISYEVKHRYSCDDARKASGHVTMKLLNMLLDEKLDSEKRAKLERAKKVTKFEGILAGVGALGSSMADIWSRECWGNWTYVDDDTLEPHNIIRHIGKDFQIGENKARVVKVLTDSNFSTGVQKSKIIESKVNQDNPEINEALSQADLLVDVTTTLDAPRDLSLIEDAPRMVSVFITPSGNDSVLLIEDDKRTIRLSSLEAQYYRAIINQKWGKEHLKGNLGKVTVGAGCRDSSFIMSYESIQLHSAILAKQVREKTIEEKAQIQIWTAKKDSSIKTFQIPVHSINTQVCGEWQIVWDDGLTAKAIKYRATELPVETGGVILGYSDQKTKTIHVVDIIPAPDDSDGDRGSFLRGVEGMKKLRKKSRKRTANIVDYIGDWHSHPKAIPTDKSEKDVIQLKEITRTMASEGLPALMVIVGDSDISFHIKANSSTLSFKNID